jgi:hypothetical protein
VGLRLVSELTPEPAGRDVLPVGILLKGFQRLFGMIEFFLVERTFFSAVARLFWVGVLLFLITVGS